MNKSLDTVVIPVAGMGTRFLPATKVISKEMLPIMDRPILDYALEEAKKAGIKKFIFIVNPRNNFPKLYLNQNKLLENYLYKKNHIDLLKKIQSINIDSENLHFVVQKEPLGLGHAILCAKDLIKNKPFAVILPDDLIIGNNCIKELSNVFDKKKSSIIGVMKVKDKDINKYGIIKTGNIKGKTIEIKNLVEKPTLNNAPSNLAVVGRYILNQNIISILENTKTGTGNEIQLTDAIAKSIESEKVYGYKFTGRRFDCGNILGSIKAQIAAGLMNKELSKDILEIIKDEIKIMDNKT